MVEIGYDVIVPVTEDMLLTVREGEYTLRIAKGDDVGTKTVEVIKNQEVDISLADIAIEPKQTGSVLFSVTPSNATVYIDGKKVNTEGAIDLLYGKHDIYITAKGYNSYSASFNVNYAYKIKKYTLFPKTTNGLRKMIKSEIKKNGNECSLNHIDVSKITDMSKVFYHSKFNGDISKWDVSNVRNMRLMFKLCHYFNKPLNDWDVSNVENMEGMFDMATEFNQPLNNWKLSDDVVTVDMFHSAYKFKQDLSSWDLRHIIVSRRRGMFTLTKMTKKYLPRFK